MISNTKNTKNHTLLYFGSGWHFTPTDDPAYKKFNHFIFIDSLPKLSHYEPGMPGYEKSKDRTSFINTLKNEASQYGYILSSIVVTEALDDKIIRKKMNKTKWLHEESFYPYEYGLKVGDLPNLLEYRAKIKEL